MKILPADTPWPIYLKATVLALAAGSLAALLAFLTGNG